MKDLLRSVSPVVDIAESDYPVQPIPLFFLAETGYVTVSDKDPRTRELKTAERFTLLPAGVAPSAMNTSNTSTKDFRAFYYDAKGRVRQVAKTNTQDGTDRISSSYSFAGNLLKERQKIQPGNRQTFHTLDRTYTYDARLRLCSISASLDGGASATQGITYDDLQRTHTINRGNGTEITSLLYTLQGWLSSATSTSWEETLRYASPFLSTDPLPGKTGLITEWKQQQKGTSSNGSTTTETYTYSYDKAGRLTGSLRYIGTSSSSVNTLTERSITYDRSGNLLTLDRYGDSSETSPTESLSYTYTGPKRNTWTYDAHGNVTTDHQAGLGIAWNAIGLPRTITASAGTGSATTQRFYLADGTLAQVSDGTTTRLYLGDMVFDKAANGTVTLESAGWEGGRLLPGMGADKVLYVVTDHLGSVRVVKDGMGAIRQRFDYYPYGTVSRTWASSVTTDYSEKRYRFGGKEVAGSALMDLTGMGSSPGAPYLDYGARLYNPGAAMWLSADPLMEKYYGIGPNVYCAGNPVNLVDPDGNAANPVYDFDGNFRGTTIEGFTGEVIIYDGEIDFSDMTAPDLIYDETFDLEAGHGEARTYDSVREELSGSAKSKIWTHIASQMEGQQVYDEVFFLSSLSDGIISYSSSDSGSWVSKMRENRITGTDKYSYETTVENIQSSVIVHEWYSHIMKRNGDRFKSHRLAYKNVINYKSLWNRTTPAYKGFIMRRLLDYTKKETGRMKVDPLYRNLYEMYNNVY